MKNKYLYILPLLVFVFFFVSNNAYATSGACSYHGGVDCGAGAALDGNAQCNDGTESSVPYADMEECDTDTSDCSLPTPTGCTTQSDYTQEQALCTEEQQSQQSECGQETEAYASEGIEQQAPCDTSTPEACTEASLCEAQISEYQSEVQQTKQCLATEQADEASEAKLQQQADQQEQESEAADSCDSQIILDGTYAYSNGTCTLTCNSGYTEANGSCKPITTPSAVPVQANVTTLAIPEIAPANQSPSTEHFFPNKGVSAPVASKPNGIFETTQAPTASSTSSKLATSTPIAKKSLWQSVMGFLGVLNPFHWF